MRKIVFLFYSLALWSDVLIIDSFGDKDLIEKITGAIKDKIFLTKPDAILNNFEAFNYVVLLGEKALEVYKEKNIEKPCVVGFVKNPFKEIPITGTGVKYSLPPSTLLQIISNSCKWAKKVGTVVPYEYTDFPYIKELQRVSQTLGIELKIIFLKGKAVKKAIEELKGIDLLILIPTELTVSEDAARYFIEQSLQFNIPVFGFEKKHAIMGAIMSYDVEKYYIKDFFSVLEEVAKGKNPSLIPVKYPSEYDLYIKKKTLELFKLKIDKLSIKNVHEI